MQSPDVELVEPEDLDLKVEKVDANMAHIEETEEDVPLIGDDGEFVVVVFGVVYHRELF